MPARKPICKEMKKPQKRRNGEIYGLSTSIKLMGRNVKNVFLIQKAIKRCVSIIKEFKPDIVTMDITMPKLDGIDAVSEILKINPAAKIVMVTAAGQKTNIVEALKRGAADFIQKPFESSAIVSVLEKVMGE